VAPGRGKFRPFVPYFELKEEEGEIVAISKLYGRKESAEETIELIKSSMRQQSFPRMASHSHAASQIGIAARGYAGRCAAIRDTAVI
jgi:uncharacterized protein YegP (UPF0339 family)